MIDKTPQKTLHDFLSYLDDLSASLPDFGLTEVEVRNFVDLLYSVYRGCDYRIERGSFDDMMIGIECRNGVISSFIYDLD